MGRWRCSVLVVFAVSLVGALAWCGCGQKKASPKADAGELERAFSLQPGAVPGDETTPAGLAAKAVAAIRAQDWVNAVPMLTQLRTTKGLTPQQFEAVHNANGNAYVRLVELANKGNQEAKETLQMLKKAADRR